MKTERQVLINRLSVIGLLALSIIGMIIVPHGSATIIVNVDNVTPTSIMWSWSPIIVKNITLDGIYVQDVNPASTKFTQGGLGPGEPHTIIVESISDSGTNTTYTSTSRSETESNILLTLLTTWWYLILILLLMLVGMKPKLGIFLIVASMVSLYALYDFITTHTVNQELPLTEIPFLIYIVFFVIPLFIVFIIKRGVFR
jgi:hypothetical protein